MKKQLLIMMLASVCWSAKGQNGVTTYTVSTSLGTLRNCLTIDNAGNKWIGTNNGIGSLGPLVSQNMKTTIDRSNPKTSKINLDHFIRI